MTEAKSGEISQEDLKQGLTDIFSAIMDEESRNAREALSVHENDPEVVEATAALRGLDYRRFRSSLIRRHDQIAEALIQKVHGDNHHLVFFLTKQDFVGSHLQKLFQDIEGNSSCVDKEGTVMRALLRYYHFGKEIAFDYDAEYTYMLPRVILRNHDSIISYFDSLYRLYYGNPKPYLAEMLKIAQVSQASKANTTADIG